jgi:hypothetical protein
MTRPALHTENSHCALPQPRSFFFTFFFNYILYTENLCRNRALETFRLSPEEWGVNVQVLSGSPNIFKLLKKIQIVIFINLSYY